MRVEKNNVKSAPDTLSDTHCFSSSPRYKMLFRLCLIAIITPTRKQRSKCNVWVLLFYNS
ncbi:hypothetical protein FXO05_21770 [Klebsiella pneumoniae]|nr:hypothetical protein FXO05_21770 [Klebsiella pneumoniae]